jgi:hypothetical protein
VLGLNPESYEDALGLLLKRDLECFDGFAHSSGPFRRLCRHHTPMQTIINPVIVILLLPLPVWRVNRTWCAAQRRSSPALR